MLLASINVYSQDILSSNIQWKSSSFFDASDGTEQNVQTTITTSSNQIVWRDANGSVKYDLTIVQSTGSWSNVSQNGSMGYQVLAGSNNGIVEFKRASGIIQARILIVEGETTSLYDVTIAGFEPI